MKASATRRLRARGISGGHAEDSEDEATRAVFGETQKPTHLDRLASFKLRARRYALFVIEVEVAVARARGMRRVANPY
jgi:hypothetical protein